MPPIDPNQPESFETTPPASPQTGPVVPHDSDGNVVAPESSRIRTARYGELEAHELVHLLDSIEDERARGRFRESIYISVFVWLAIAWFVFYGPRVLWHAPKLMLPSDAMKQHELTMLTAPVLPKAPMMKAIPRNELPPPKPQLSQSDKFSMEKSAAPTPKSEEPQPPAPSPRRRWLRAARRVCRTLRSRAFSHVLPSRWPMHRRRRLIPTRFCRATPRTPVRR